MILDNVKDIMDRLKKKTYIQLMVEAGQRKLTNTVFATGTICKHYGFTTACKIVDPGCSLKEQWVNINTAFIMSFQIQLIM